MNISGPAAVAKPEMLFYAPGDLTVTIQIRKRMDSTKAFACNTENVDKFPNMEDYQQSSI